MDLTTKLKFGLCDFSDVVGTNVISIRSTDLFVFTGNLRKNSGVKSDALRLIDRNRQGNHKYIVCFCRLV